MKISTVGRAAGLVAAIILALTAPGAPAAIAQMRSDDFPAALLAVVQLAALIASGWVLLVLIGGAARVRIPGVPVAVRAALFTTVVVAAVASPAHADSAHDLDGLTLPDRPTTTAAPFDPIVDPSSVTVRTGDTLWALAADHLPRDASAQRIAGSVASWHAANRQVIGPDPDLIMPGQVLTPPIPEQDTP